VPGQRPLTTATSPEQFDRFGPLLRYLRVRAHLSQRDLAIAVGYSEAHLSRLEQGQRRPDPDAVRAHFLPALDLEDEPAWAARLLALATGENASSARRASAPETGGPSRPPSPERPPSELLATKFYRPPQRPGLVHRADLLARLDAVGTTPLTLITAPAGFGKSTLVAGWLSEVEREARGREGSGGLRTTPPLRSGWLSLDAGDNDLAVFVRYLAAALHAAAPGGGEAALALLEGPQLPTIGALVVALVNGLAGLRHEAVVVLDDYHTITSAPVQELMVALVERLPPRLHLVLAARAEPPLPLARLRARGQLLELRAADLRFRQDETDSFLRATMGLALSDAVAAALAARTEGWVAGLQLAALALREHADQEGFVAAFAGSNRYVLDYLAEEVLARLPAHLQRFLVQTSFLERLSGPLCDALLGVAADAGDSYSRLLLRELERQQLFLVPLDAERRWYRYHHLFAEVLRARLREGVPAAQVRELYRRAASAEPSPERGVGYLLEGQLWEEAADRIAGLGGGLLAVGRHATLEGWIARLPSEFAARPRLQVLLGVAMARLGQGARAEALLEAGAAGCRLSGDGEGESRGLAELALLALLRGELAQSLARFERALALPSEPAVRAYTLVCAIGAYTLGERLDLVSRSAAELFALVGTSDDRELLAGALVGAHAIAACALDQLAPLEQLCRRGLALLGGHESFITASAEAALAHIAWQRGRVGEALNLSARVLAAWQRLGVYGPIAPQMLSVAGAAAVARGDLERGAALFEAALREGTQVGLYTLSHPGQIYVLARAYWQLGRTDALWGLEPEMAGAGASGGALKETMHALLRALIALEEGRRDDAAELLETVASREAGVALMPVYGSAHPLLAHLHLLSGRPAEATAALAPLLARCARDDTPGRLLFEGPYVIPLLRLAVAEEAQSRFAAHTLALWEAASRSG
jgi:LuxR family transcriptional regulator, maltose regulon positive regulatory protein